MKATIAHALPNSCFLPGGMLFPIRSQMLPRLQTVMTSKEIIAASQGEQPHLDKMRPITCRSCGEIRCPLNFKHSSLDDELTDLMRGQRYERRMKGDQLLEKLLPTPVRNHLAQSGIRAEATQMPSRKNPQLSFWFIKGDARLGIRCDIGRRRIAVTGRSLPPYSLDQLRSEILNAVIALS